MLKVRSFRGSMIYFFLVTCFFCISGIVSAAIPRNDLRLELLFAGGNATDTSGTNRIVTASGASPAFGSDSTFNSISFAKFNGTGGLKTNTAWVGATSADFTISFYVSVKKSDLPTLLSKIYTDPLYNWNIGYMYHQVLFSTQTGHNESALKLGIRNNYQCQLGGVQAVNLQQNQIIGDGYYYDYEIDCTKLSDEKWHNITLVRRAGTISFRIDGIQITTITKAYSVPPTLTLGIHGMTPLETARLYSPVPSPLQEIYQSTFFKGSIAAFRLYSVALSETDLASLKDEFSAVLNNSITINNPDTTPASSKSISATASTGGSLTMSLTRGAICDGSLIFIAYSDLVFTAESDIGQKVCYKAVFPGGATIYKLSNPISAISAPTAMKNTAKLFDNYTYWAKSSYQKTDDTAGTVLDLLAVGASTPGTLNGVTLTDINGDGLVDFLYSRNDLWRSAIVVNNGNYTFKVVYRCAVDYLNWPTSQAAYYYGDCADPNR